MIIFGGEKRRVEDMKKIIYNSQDVAQILGISKQTLYRYEKKRIFPKARRNPINNRREYAQDEINKLKKVLGRS
jgi:DNA-binding transcriptional MerR regulator